MTRINDEFETRTQVRTVIVMYRNGNLIHHPDGRPFEYASEEEAAYMARNWHVYGANPRTLSDRDLRRLAGEMSWLERGRHMLLGR